MPLGSHDLRPPVTLRSALLFISQSCLEYAVSARIRALFHTIAPNSTRLGTEYGSGNARGKSVLDPTAKLKLFLYFCNGISHSKETLVLVSPLDLCSPENNYYEQRLEFGGLRPSVCKIAKREHRPEKFFRSPTA